VNKFIFDVDGTLTPSRGRMDYEFKAFFNTFCLVNDVYLVTGSDKPKTVEQIGETFNLCKRVYNCSGNEVWEKDTLVRRNDWTLPNEAHEWLTEQLTASAFSLRTGKHFEHRTGMVNYSIVGRNANTEQRKMYVAWDEKYNERDLIAHNFNQLFSDIEARPGGETGIDIAPKGSDKSQILEDFNHEDHIHFFGDRMDEGGNDYPLKKALWDDYYQQTCYHVTDWQDTWEKLKCV
jgi:phosphomannomutase